jgi:hypothetical protein
VAMVMPVSPGSAHPAKRNRIIASGPAR